MNIKLRSEIVKIETGANIGYHIRTKLYGGIVTLTGLEKYPTRAIAIDAIPNTELQILIDMRNDMI
jgi:hypothetical protein